MLACVMGTTYPRKEQSLISADGFRDISLPKSLWACDHATRYGGFCARGRCLSYGHQKAKRESEVQVATSPSRTWPSGLAFFSSAPRGSAAPGTTQPGDQANL